MKKLLRFFVCSGFIILTVGILGTPSLEAGIKKDQEDNVFLGKWQPPKSTGGQGNFLSEERLEPGDKLAVKIFVEKPKEQVTVKLTVKVSEKADEVSEKTVKDGGKYDLLPKQKAVILFELTELLPDEGTTYIVEVDDKSGGAPVVRVLESSEGYLKSLGKAASNMLKTLLNIPTIISNAALLRVIPVSLHTLVITDRTGKESKTLTPSQKGEILSPLWLPNDQILFVEMHGTVSTLKVISATLEGTPEDFGHKITDGIEPHLAPDQKSIIFRQNWAIISTDLSGKAPVTLIQDKEVTQILGVFTDADPDSYNLVFSAKEADKNVPWLAKVQGKQVISMDRISDSPHWLLLAKVHFHGEQMLYELQDNVNGLPVWNIYLSQSPQEEGVKITTDDHNDRYPAWNPDGTKIVFVSDRLK